VLYRLTAQPGGSESRMKPIDSFAARWAEFERDIILPDSPTATERENLRRVFYAGAFAFLCVSRECAQHQDEAALHALWDEIEKHFPESVTAARSRTQRGRRDDRALDD
jgi:hypothetical protein